MKKTSSGTTTVHVRLNKELREGLAKAAKRLGISNSAVLRLALESITAITEDDYGPRQKAAGQKVAGQAKPGIKAILKRLENPAVTHTQVDKIVAYATADRIGGLIESEELNAILKAAKRWNDRRVKSLRAGQGKTAQRRTNA
jgi:hypothetical protein